MTQKKTTPKKKISPRKTLAKVREATEKFIEQTNGEALQAWQRGEFVKTSPNK